jgi:hypothetical protein
MIDKKIEEAKEEIYEDRFLLNGEEVVFDNDAKEEMFYEGDIKEAIGLGAKWMQEEFLKDLWHPASEEPKNLEYIIFTNDIFGEIYFFTMQRDNSLQSWETEVACHSIDQWAYRNDIVSLILKGDK